MMSVCKTNNTWIGEEYSLLLIEKLNVMLKREETSFSCHDYLNTASCSNPLDIDELWRQKTAEWMFKGERDFLVLITSCLTHVPPSSSHFTFVASNRLL